MSDNPTNHSANTAPELSDGLTARLLAPRVKNQLNCDCQALIKQRVAAQTGLSGNVVKSSFALLLRWRPGFLARAIDRLLPSFCHAMEPFYSAWRRQNQQSWPDFLATKSDQAVAALLQVSDAQLETHPSTRIKKIYYKLRPRAERELALALPSLAALTVNYL